MMQSNQRTTESRPTPMDEQWSYCLCCAGALMFGMSLLLPTFGNLPGYLCLLIGVYWYPSNLALLLSPIVVSFRNEALRLGIGAFLLISCFYTFAIVTINGMQEPRVGFWLWLSAFLVSGIGLLISVRSSTDRNGSQISVKVTQAK